jgi:hypothetical protein
LIQRELTRTLVEEQELEPARAWAVRAGVALAWEADVLELRATFTRSSTGEQFFLLGCLEGYKAVPPAWDFRNEDWQSPRQKSNYPGRAVIHGIGSIFHPTPVICAPFNRLAYKQHGGPHNDWGGPEHWLTAAKGGAHADTLADMLAVVDRDFRRSRGRMG